MFLLNIMFPGFILVVAYICIYSFLWSNNIPLYRYIHLYIDGCFYLLTVLNCATMNICAYVFLCGHRFSFLLVIYRGVELLVILLQWLTFMVNFLRKVQTVIYSVFSILYPHQQHKRIPTSPYPCLNLLLSFFFNMTILMDVKQYLIVVLFQSFFSLCLILGSFCCHDFKVINLLQHIMCFPIHYNFISTIILYFSSPEGH